MNKKEVVLVMDGISSLDYQIYDYIKVELNEGKSVLLKNSFGEVLGKINTIDELNTYKEKKGIN